MKYKFKYESNIGGDDGIWEFDTEAVKTIDQMMEGEYERYCDKYPTADVVWWNRLLDVGDTTEIYVSGYDDYTRIIVMW